MGLFIFRKKSKVSITDSYFLKLSYDDETLTKLKENDNVRDLLKDLPYISFSQFSLLANHLRNKQLQFEKIEVVDNSKGKSSTQNQLFAENVIIDENYLNVLQPLTEAIWNNSLYANLTFSEKRGMAEELGNLYLKETGESKLAIPYIPDQADLEDEEFYEAEFSYDYNPYPKTIATDEVNNSMQEIEVSKRTQIVPVEPTITELEEEDIEIEEQEEIEEDKEEDEEEPTILEDLFPDTDVLNLESVEELSTKRENENQVELVQKSEPKFEKSPIREDVKPLWADQLTESEEFDEQENQEENIQGPQSITVIPVSQEIEDLSDAQAIMAKATEVALQIIDNYEAKQKAKIFKDLSDMDNRALIKEQVLENIKRGAKEEKKIVLIELNDEKEQLLEAEDKRHKEVLLQIQQDFESKMSQIEKIVVNRLKGPAQEEINVRFKQETSRLNEILKSKIEKLESIKISLRETVLTQLETAVAEISDSDIIKHPEQPTTEKQNHRYMEPDPLIDEQARKEEERLTLKRQYQRLESTPDFEETEKKHIHSNFQTLLHR